VRADVTRTALLEIPLPGAFTGAVLEVSADNVIPRLDRQGAGNDVDARRGVGDEDELVAAAAEIGGHLGAGIVEEIVGAPAEELDRLPFKLPLPALVLVKDRFRSSAERSVIEEDDVRIDQEFLAQ
jgi:hypothetical protein